MGLGGKLRAGAQFPWALGGEVDFSVVNDFPRAGAEDNGAIGKSSHAWAEAFVPELGWIAFDPANGFCPTDAHVRVAIGLDAVGAAPVRGTRYGPGAETLEVAIKVGQ